MQLTMRLLNLQKTARESFFSTKASSKEHQKDVSEQANVSDTLQIPRLSDDASLLCWGELPETELYKALKNMPNNGSAGDDVLTKEFYLSFWDNVKDIYISSIQTTVINKEFSISPRQAIIKLIEKKGKEKSFIKNWQFISVLNVDYKKTLKTLT